MLEFFQEHWRSAVEILILWVFIYQMYRAFRATRGARILVGLAIILIALTLVSQVLQLEGIGFIITRVAGVAALALLIIFQPELRRMLAQLGNLVFQATPPLHHPPQPGQPRHDAARHRLVRPEIRASRLLL